MSKELPEPVRHQRHQTARNSPYPAGLSTVGIVGSGIMGRQIAETFCKQKATVSIVEPNALQRQLTEQKLKQFDITFVSDIHELAPCSVVIEAVPENLELKERVLKAVETHLSPKLLGSNTSSIPISSLNKSLQNPGRFVGTHFFQPLERTRLVEIVPSDQTHEDTVNHCISIVQSFGSYPLLASDTPGFATSRLAVATGLEAIRMVQDGVATVQDIDEGITRGYGHPIGPLEMSDIVGLDTRLNIARTLHKLLGERFEPPKLLLDMVDSGRTGAKSGQGFYIWE